MADLQRVVITWTGGTGLPGVNVVYGDTSVPSVVTDMLDFFDAIKGLIPSSVTVNVPSNGDLIDDATGTLSGSWSGSEGGSVTGTSGVSYGAGVGVAIQWNTNGIRNGRRVRGRTFVAPLTSDIFQNDGTIGSTPRTTLQTAASAVATAGHLTIWSRPTTSGGSDGTSNLVLSATVPDRVTALRSRRY